MRGDSKDKEGEKKVTMRKTIGKTEDIAVFANQLIINCGKLAQDKIVGVANFC